MRQLECVYPELASPMTTSRSSSNRQLRCSTDRERTRPVLRVVDAVTYATQNVFYNYLLQMAGGFSESPPVPFVSLT